MGLHRSISEYMANERAKRGETGNLPLWQKSLVSMGTGAVGAVLGCPMDVALVRMQADTTAVGADKRNYKGIIDAISRMISEEGVMVLWSGTFPLIARGAAMNLGQMASYDFAKEKIIESRGPGMETNLLAAAASGFTAAFASLPFDMMKSRLMNQKPDANGKLPYNGLLDCGWQVLTKEGPHRFWAGYWTYYARCAPTAMIQLIAIEQFTSMYKKKFFDEDV
jgi:solute carrier family 25 oxoglutarate transporter 11